MQNKPWLFPEGIERSYARELINLSRKAQAAAKEKLSARQIVSRAVRLDTWSDDLSQIILELLSAMLAPGQEAVFRLRDTFTAVSQFNDTQWRIQVRAGTGVEIGPSGTLPNGARLVTGNMASPDMLRARFGMGVDVYRSEPWLARLQENWIADNTRLIKGLTDSHINNIERVIREGVMGGQSQRTIAKALQALGGISENRAKLIAADQVGKANGALTQHRHEDLGVTRYKWSDSDDRRVRRTHAANNGQIFEWKKGPANTKGRHPGQEIRCRCSAIPVLSDVAAGRAGTSTPSRRIAQSGIVDTQNSLVARR